MKTFSRATSIALFTILLLAITSFAQGAVGPASATGTAVTYNVGESLTLSVTGGTLVIPSSGNSNNITATANYNLIAANHTSGIWIATWMGSTTAALTDGTHNIASSNVGVVASGGLGNGACGLAADAHTGSLAGATCDLGNAVVQSVLATTPTGTFNYTFALNIVNPTGIAAGNYTGTFYVQVMAP